jgi:ABC-type multidrug transport system fused ATPase/permease subunit
MYSGKIAGPPLEVGYGSGIFSDDCLKLVRVIGSDIYQFKFVKQLLKLTLIAYLTLLFLQLYYFFQTPICVFIFKTTMYLGGLVMAAQTYQIIYFTQQVKFQEFEDPIRNEIYQKVIETKLNMIIDRHCVFLR